MSQGFASRLGVDVLNPTTFGYEFDSCGLTARADNVDTGGLRGTRSHDASRVRQGLIHVGGPIAIEPSPNDLAGAAGWLQWILGGTPSGSSYPLADALSSRFVQVGKVAKCATYAGCYINKATFQGSEGTPLRLTVDVIGQTEVISSTFPSGLTYNLVAPFMFFDSVLTILTVGRAVKDWTLTIDNQLEVEFNNSQTATKIQPQNRTVSFSCTNPYTSAEIDLYNIALTGSNAASLVCTMGAKVLTFSFAALQFAQEGPTVDGRKEIPIKMNGIARATGLDGSPVLELVTTLALS